MVRVLDDSAASIGSAAEALRRGEVVAFPTETVYGLGALTLDEGAVQRIYALKGRPADNPLIAHVADFAQAETVAHLDERARRVAAAFWPGALTLVVPKRAEVSARATGGRTTIAVRSPDHPAALALLRAAGGAISAPSANRSGRISPTTAAHVVAAFAEVPEAANLVVIDGGPCRVGMESTVLDLSGDAPRILRPGAVTADALRPVLGGLEVMEADGQGASPGTRLAHYGPRAPLRLVERAALATALETVSRDRGRAVVLGNAESEVPSPHLLVTMPEDAEGYARALYAAMHEADAAHPSVILVITPPDRSGVWQAVHDRLRRAAATVPEGFGAGE